MGCRLVALVLLLCLELCRKSLHAAPHRVCVLSSTEEHKSNPEAAAGRGLLRERWGRLRAVCGLCWFKAIMLRGLLIGKAGVLLMIAVFGK